MTFAIIQKFRFIFDEYFLAFTAGSCIYGLIVDIYRKKTSNTKRDEKIIKRIYTSIIVISLAFYILSKFL